MSREAAKPKPLRFLLGPAGLAAVLFVSLFVFQGIGPLDFWWWMTLNVALLFVVSVVADRSYISRLSLDLKSGLRRKVFLGILSALLLYGIFVAGNAVVRLSVPSSGQAIQNVYAFKEGASVLRVALLVGLAIGPGEELFWRGFLQHHAQVRLGVWPGAILTTALYALVHMGSLNPLLVLAAAVCGLFWGVLYALTRSVVSVALSHTFWDLLIFVFWPL